tara:strand:- start:115 stop:273 length:159 start_codon:yes stop_codon:yes gene_type:complete
MVTHKNSLEGEQWITHTFRDDELDYMLAKIRDWESRNIPYEHTYEREWPNPM